MFSHVASVQKFSDLLGVCEYRLLEQENIIYNDLTHHTVSSSGEYTLLHFECHSHNLLCLSDQSPPGCEI